MKKADKKGKQRYPLLPYLIGLFVTVVLLVLLSYLAEQRNNKELNEYGCSQGIIAVETMATAE